MGTTPTTAVIAPHRRLLTAREAADRLSVSTWRLYELVREGSVPAVRMGRTIRVDSDLLEDWIRSGGTGMDND